MKMRKLTTEQRAVWGTCALCNAVHGEACRQVVLPGPMGRLMDGVHMGRLHVAPVEVPEDGELDLKTVEEIEEISEFPENEFGRRIAEEGAYIVGQLTAMRHRIEQKEQRTPEEQAFIDGIPGAIKKAKEAFISAVQEVMEAAAQLDAEELDAPLGVAELVGLPPESTLRDFIAWGVEYLKNGPDALPEPRMMDAAALEDTAAG